MNKFGVWGLWSRGTDPKAYDPWVEQDITDKEFSEIIAMFLGWKAQGQHVRLEWVPEGAIGPTTMTGRTIH